MQPTPLLKKPLLRGYFHQEAFFMALGACLLLIAKSSFPRSFWAALIYSLSLFGLFGISAIYHRPQWASKPRAFLKRLDHSAIFLLIAGTFTPICLLALSPDSGDRLLKIIWLAAFAGILQSIFWVKAPKWVSAILYVAMGFIISPYLEELKITLGPRAIQLILAGGFVFTLGAIFYALKWPQLKREIFGYHELFHVLTIIGTALHFAVIYPLIR